MKTTLSTFAIASLVLIIASCEGLLDDSVRNDHDRDLIVTGLKQSLGIAIITSNSGRVENDPDTSGIVNPTDIKNLTVFILDAQEVVVYENHYYGYNYEDFYQSMPDSIFIPSLEEGAYTIHAVTLDYWDYYPYDDYYGNSNSRLTLAPYHYGMSPIYVGSEAFDLTEDAQVVEITMSNISAQIEIKLADGQELQNAFIGVMFETAESHSYSFLTGEFSPFNEGYNVSYYASLNDYYYWEYGQSFTTETHLFILPSTLSKITVEYSDYYGNYITQSMDIDPYLELAADDKITIVLDIDQILEGAGSGVFNWQDIEWNDRGELTIP